MITCGMANAGGKLVPRSNAAATAAVLRRAKTFKAELFTTCARRPAGARRARALEGKAQGRTGRDTARRMDIEAVQI